MSWSRCANQAGLRYSSEHLPHSSLTLRSIEAKQLPPLAVEPATAEGEAGAAPRPAFLAARNIAVGEAVLAVPGDLAVTSVDVGKDAALAALAEGRSELVGLALWLMQERDKVRGGWEWQAMQAGLPPHINGKLCCTAAATRDQPFPLLPQGAASEWAPFLVTLPRATLTPILWPDEERQQLLRGSPVLQVRQ